MHPLDLLFIERTHIIGMDTHRTVNIRIALHQIHGTIPAFYFRAYIDHSADALRRQDIQQFFSIFVKGSSS